MGKKMISRRQHYLPQFYLRQWADDKNRVWAYHQNKEPFLVTLKNIGCENYLYSINRNDYLEQWLALIDGDLSTVIEELKNSDSLNENVIMKLKAFLIILMARNPKSKSISDSIMNVSVNNTTRENSFAQTLRFRTEVLANEIEPLNIAIHHIPQDIEFSFVTSNQPFYIVGKPENQFDINPYSNEIIQRKSIQRCWMPLTPKIMVFFTSNQVQDQVVIGDHREYRLINMNKNLVYGSNQYLISNSASLFKSQPELKNIFTKLEK
jgi:hypothetical protein